MPTLPPDAVTFLATAISPFSIAWMSLALGIGLTLLACIIERSERSSALLDEAKEWIMGGAFVSVFAACAFCFAVKQDRARTRAALAALPHASEIRLRHVPSDDRIMLEVQMPPDTIPFGTRARVVEQAAVSQVLTPSHLALMDSVLTAHHVAALSSVHVITSTTP